MLEESRLREGHIDVVGVGVQVKRRTRGDWNS